jgi:dienelactone hydrolase
LGPCEGWDQVTYLSGGLLLTAYVDRAPADGRPRPAVLYLHGGFAFGEEDLEQAQPYRDAGFVVMVPVLRGENNQPGHFSLFYDEVDDVLAAAEALASLPYVDPDCLCVAGHSAGGTLAMLAAMASPRFRASAAFSGTANEGMLDDEMPELVVFNRADPREVLARSAEAFATSFKCSARLYFGSQEWYFKPQLDRTAQRAKQKGIDVEVMQVPGDHFTMLELAIPQSVQFFRSRVQTGPRMTPESPLSDAPRGTRPPPWEPAPGIPATPGSSSDPSSPPWTRPAPPSFPTPSPSVPTPPSFPMPPGYTPPPWPSRPSPPGRPGEAPPVPRPPLAPSVKPLTLTPTDAVQPPLVAFVMLGYQGTGDPTEAARQALRDVPWADGRVQVDQPGGRILIGVRGSSVSSATAATALQRAGFQLGGVTFRPR